MRKYGRQCWMTRNEYVDRGYLRLLRGDWIAMGTMQGPRVSFDIDYEVAGG